MLLSDSSRSTASNNTLITRIPGRLMCSCCGAGSTATCPGVMTKLLRVAPGQVQGRMVPYVSDAIMPRDDPGCPPGARLCWLHDHKARLLLEGAAKCGYKCVFYLKRISNTVNPRCMQEGFQL